MKSVPRNKLWYRLSVTYIGHMSLCDLPCSSENHIGTIALCVSWICCLLAHDMFNGGMGLSSIFSIFCISLRSFLVTIEFVEPESRRAVAFVVLLFDFPISTSRNGSLE